MKTLGLLSAGMPAGGEKETSEKWVHYLTADSEQVSRNSSFR